jgi:asparagine synthase (glutamine-hydrolysing)
MSDDMTGQATVPAPARALDQAAPSPPGSESPAMGGSRAGERDPLGLVRRFRRDADGQIASRIRELLPSSRADRALDPRGVATAWGEHPECESTCFAGIVSLPRGAPGDPAARSNGPADTRAPGRIALLSAAAAMRARSGITAVALSGGLDSALVIALLRATGVTDLQLYTVSSGFPGYDELDLARATAQHFGYPLTVVRVTERDFVEALPACVMAAETALYNLHPIERFLLARAAAADGHRDLVTGDGADQVFGGAPPAIFLPIVAALFEAAGLRVRSPFLEPSVVALGLAGPPDPAKPALRALAAELGVPPSVRQREKHVRLAPGMDLATYLLPSRLEPLGRALGREVRLASDRERVQWATLGLLWELL